MIVDHREITEINITLSENEAGMLRDILGGIGCGADKSGRFVYNLYNQLSDIVKVRHACSIVRGIYNPSVEDTN
jgi:hypothetical protein